MKEKTETGTETEKRTEGKLKMGRLGGEDQRKSTKTEKIAELFGGTEKQRLEREKMEELRRNDKAKQRENKVRNRVKEIEIGRGEQVDGVRGQERDMRVSVKLKDQKVENKKNERVSISTKFEQNLKISKLKSGGKEMGNLNCRPAHSTKVGVVKNVLVGKLGTRQITDLTAVPSTRRTFDGTSED